MGRPDDLDRAVQHVVEEKLNPVPFGRLERTVLWVAFVLAVVSTLASVLTIVLTY